MHERFGPFLRYTTKYLPYTLEQVKVNSKQNRCETKIDDLVANFASSDLNQLRIYQIIRGSREMKLI